MTMEQQKRSIRFGGCEVREIEHLNDCTDEDVAAKWLTAEEFQEIHDGYNGIVERLIAGEEFQEDDEHAARRGLECWIPSIADEKTQAIYDAVRSVLVEQDMQYGEDIEDADLLAEAYQQCLGDSAEQAHAAALEDEQVANRIYGHCFIQGKSKDKKQSSRSSSRKGRRSVISQIKGAAKSMQRMRR